MIPPTTSATPGRRFRHRQCLFLGRVEAETATAGREDNEPLDRVNALHYTPYQDSATERGGGLWP